MSKGSGLPEAAYADAGVYELERRDLFGRSWIVVGRADEILEVGGYFTWDRTRVPLVMMRSVDGRVRALYNSCRHRGAPVVRTPCGRARAFRCQYHSWTYDSFGRLVALPDERDFGHVDRDAYSLVPLQISEVGGWLFVNQDAAGAALTDQLGGGAATLERLGEGRAFVERRIVSLQSNWKAVVERLAELNERPEIAGAVALSLAPNLTLVEAGAELRALLAWPRDERTTDLEVVRCAPPGATEALGEAWTTAGAALETALRELADGIAASGVRGDASRLKAAQLAAELARRFGPGALSGASAHADAPV